MDKNPHDHTIEPDLPSTKIMDKVNAYQFNNHTFYYDSTAHKVQSILEYLDEEYRKRKEKGDDKPS